MSWLEIYGRGKPHVSEAAATADLSAAFRESYRTQLALEPQYTPPIEVAKPRMFLSPMLAERGPRPSADGRVAAWLFGVTGIVLAHRVRERRESVVGEGAEPATRGIAVRLALGVSRARLVRHLLLESMILALLGGVAGLALAQSGGRLLRPAGIRAIRAARRRARGLHRDQPGLPLDQNISQHARLHRRARAHRARDDAPHDVRRVRSFRRLALRLFAGSDVDALQCWR